MSTHEDSQIVPIKFSSSIDDELRMLNAEMRVFRILQSLASEKVPTEEEKADLRHMLLILADLFSTSLPPIEENPMDMLKLAARDIKLATLLRERGLARLYRLTTLHINAYDELTKQSVLLPAFMAETNPDTLQRFKHQEEFIGWFCKEAIVPRSTVFGRLRTYDRMLAVGMTIEEAFEVVLKKPYASREALNEVSTWNKDELVNIEPDVAVRLTRAMLPANTERVEGLIQAMQDAESPQEQEDLREELLEEVKPALRQMLTEVAAHESLRDVMDMVRHDIAGKPEIKYWYDLEHGWFKVEYLEKKVDAVGNPYVAKIHEINLIPENLLPREVVEDIARRLNVKNRELDLR